VTTVLTTGYNVVKTPNVVQAQQRVYMLNDFDAMKVSDDGLSIRAVGITAPVTDPSAPTQASGNCSVGTHLLRYRWQDSKRNRLSNPSNAISVTISSSAQQLTVTNVVSADSNVDQIVWEMTAAGASAYYRVSTVTNAAGTTVISVADQNLINLVPTAFYGDFGHNAPPLSYLACDHKQRVFLWGATTRTFSSCGVTNASPTISGTGFSTQWAGRRVAVTGTSGYFYISSATTTAITLTSNFTGSTNASATITVDSGAPDLLCWSQSGYPESFDATSLARRITLATGDTPAAMASYDGDLYLIGKRSMRRLNYTSDPAKGLVIPLPTSLGAYNQRCVIPDAGGLCIGWGLNGVWAIDSIQPTKISEPIDTTIASLADATKTDQRFLAYDPIQRTVSCFFCLSGETSCRAAATYSLTSKVWSLWYFRQGMTAATLNSSYSDRVRLMLCDVNGYSWRVGIGKNDGGDYGVYSVTSTSTTTVVQSTTSALVGQEVYRPSTAEISLITAVTASSFTVSPAFATAPAAGEAMWVGSLKQRVLTNWYIADGLDKKKRPAYLLISVRPNTFMGTANVYIYTDYSSTAASLTSLATDVFGNGITIGSNYVQINLDNAASDGFFAVPLIEEWHRAIRCEVISQTPYDGVRFLDIRFASRIGDDDTPEVGE
jgi:hypothetical protein